MSSANCAEVPGGKDLASMISKLEITDYVKAFDCVDHNRLWKILQEMGNTRPPYLPSEKLVLQVKK